MSKTVYVNVNEEGVPYYRHDTMEAALKAQLEFPNDTIETRQTGPFVNGYCTKCNEPEGNCEGHVIATFSTPVEVEATLLVTGNPMDGLRFRVFPDAESATRYTDVESFAWDWWIAQAPVESPAVVVVEKRDEGLDVSTYNLPVLVIEIDWDYMGSDMDYARAKHAEVRKTGIPPESKESLLLAIEATWPGQFLA